MFLQRIRVQDATGNIVRTQAIRPVSKSDGTLGQVLNFDLAVNNYAKPGTPDEQRTTTYLHVSAWDKDAQKLAGKLKAGMPFRVSGTLEARPFTRGDGSKGLGLELRMSDNGYEFITVPRKQQVAADSQAAAGGEGGGEAPGASTEQVIAGAAQSNGNVTQATGDPF